MRAFQAAPRWDGAAAGPWLSRITVNLAIDRWRRNRRRADTFSPLAEDDHTASLADTSPAPDGRRARTRDGRAAAGGARPAAGAPACRRRPAALPGAEPRGDRPGARHEPRDGEEQPAPGAPAHAAVARGRNPAMILSLSGWLAVREHLRLRGRVGLARRRRSRGPRARRDARAHRALSPLPRGACGAERGRRRHRRATPCARRSRTCRSPCSWHGSSARSSARSSRRERRPRAWLVALPAAAAVVAVAFVTPQGRRSLPRRDASRRAPRSPRPRRHPSSARTRSGASSGTSRASGLLAI